MTFKELVAGYTIEYNHTALSLLLCAPENRERPWGELISKALLREANVHVVLLL